MASSSDSRNSGSKTPNQKPTAPSDAEFNSLQSYTKTNLQIAAEQEKTEISAAMATTQNEDKMASTSDGHISTNMTPNEISKTPADGEGKDEHSYEKTNDQLGAVAEKSGNADAMGKKFHPAANETSTNQTTPLTRSTNWSLIGSSHDDVKVKCSLCHYWFCDCSVVVDVSDCR